MEYAIEYTSEAISGLEALAKNEPKAYTKAKTMIEELKAHPKTGTGHPEPLKGMPEGRWSRRITKKHRLVYRIYDDAVLVLVLRAYGHYEDR
ncbi:MAG: Txe/YoeB family addiction module toxin [Bacteroidaceae bacterium]|nr:Txe/YoeB family addiction module toxin [Bacteroidaceae bacterium]MBO7347657.1 Txe/YoeB family addiction module toxin [Bacteroidaceae bacterium]